MTFAERTALAKKKAQELDTKTNAALAKAGVQGASEASVAASVSDLSFTERSALARQRAADLDFKAQNATTESKKASVTPAPTPLFKALTDPTAKVTPAAKPYVTDPADRVQPSVLLGKKPTNYAPISVPKKSTPYVAEGKTDYIKGAAEADKPIGYNDVGLTGEALEARKSELKKQIATLSERNRVLGQARGILPATEQKEYSENAALITSASQELKTLERAGSYSQNDVYARAKEDAKAAENKSGADLAKTAGGARVGNADTIGAKIDEAAAVNEDNKDITDAAERNIARVDYVNKYADKTYEDEFTGQFGANYTTGRLTQDQSFAWNEYLDNPTPENRAYAEAIDQLLIQFQNNNADALDDNAKFKLISKTLANYLPQFIDQLKYEAVGAAAGFAVGTLAGNPSLGVKAGAIAGSGVYSYKQMRGAAFKNLIDLGVDEETARAASNDEALLSSIIEMADTGIDIATLGAGTVINAVTKGGLKALAKKGSEWAAEAAWKKFGVALAKYGFNILGEGLQEETQEAVTIANEDRVVSGDVDSSLVGGAAGVFYNDYVQGDNKANQERIAAAGAEGRRIALLMGGATMVATQVAQQGAKTINDAINSRAEIQAVEALSDETKRSLLVMGVMASEPGSQNMTVLSDALTKMSSEEGLSAKEYIAAWKQVSLNPETVAGAVSENPDEATYSQTKLTNPETTVLDPTASTLAQSSNMSAKEVQVQSELLAKVFSGETLSNKELRTLDVTNPVVQSIFTARTGIEIPRSQAHVASAMRDIFKTAAQQAKEVQAKQQDLAAANGAIMQARSDATAGTEQRAVAEKLTEIPGATIEQAEQLVKAAPLNAMTNQTSEILNYADGTTATKAQFVADYQARNPGADLAQAEAKFKEWRNYNVVFGQRIPGSAKSLTAADNSGIITGTNMEEDAHGNEHRTEDAILQGEQPGNVSESQRGAGSTGRDSQERQDIGERNGRVPSEGTVGHGDSGVYSAQLIVPTDARSVMEKYGLPNLGLREATGNGEMFAAALDAAKAASQYGVMVDAHSAEQLNASGVRLFLSSDSFAGVAVEPDGNITAVFKNSNLATPKAVSDLLITALSNGGSKLDCFTTGAPNDLAEKYAKHGFKPVCWMEFNDEYAPEGWDYEFHGRPDVVFWVHNGDSPVTVAEMYATAGYSTYTTDEIHKLPKFTDYDEAWQYRDSKLKEATNEQQREVYSGQPGERKGADDAGTVAAERDALGGGDSGFNETARARLSATALESISRKRHVSAVDLGIIGGTADSNLRVETKQSASMKAAQKRLKKLGFGVVFVQAQSVGEDPSGIRVTDDAGNTHVVRGVMDAETDTLFICTNDAKATPLQILNHETYHLAIGEDPSIATAAVQNILAAGFADEMRAVRATYFEKYGIDYACARSGIAIEDINSENLPRVIAVIDEEILADAFAGIDAYGSKATLFTGIVRETLAGSDAGERVGLTTVADISKFAWSETDATNSNVDSYGRKLTKGMAEFMAESKVRANVSPGNVTNKGPLMVVYRAVRSGLDATRSKGGDGLTFYSDRVQVCLTYMDSIKTNENAKYIKRIAKMIEQIKNHTDEVDPVTGEILNYDEVENLKKQIKDEYMKYQQYDPNVRRLNRYHDVFNKEPETYEEAVDYLIKDGAVEGEGSITQIGPDEAMLAFAPNIKSMFEHYAEFLIKANTFFGSTKITQVLSQIPEGSRQSLQAKLDGVKNAVQLSNPLSTAEGLRSGVAQIGKAMNEVDLLQAETYQVRMDFPAIVGSSFHDLYNDMFNFRQRVVEKDGFYDCQSVATSDAVSTKILFKNGNEEMFPLKQNLVNYAQNLWYKHDRKVVYESFLNMKKPYVFDCAGANYHSVKNAHGSRLRYIAQWAKNTGIYDGCIFTNVVDTYTPYSYLPGDRTSTVLVTFDDGQAKSTANATPTADRRDAWSKVDNAEDRKYTRNVSNVTEQLLQQLETGVNPYDSDDALINAVEQLPEIVKVREEEAKIAREKGPKLFEDRSPEAEAYRQKQFDDYTRGNESGSWNGKRENNSDRFEGPIKAEKKLIVVLGPPASGKSSSTANVLSYKHDAYVMDVDRIVEGHKDYNGGSGCDYVFKDSRIMRDKIERYVIAKGWNAVLPTVGEDPKKLMDKLSPYVEAGYDIEIGYVGIPLYKTLGRALSRHFDGGRFIAPDYVLEKVGVSPLQTYNDIKALWEDNNGKGENREPAREFEYTPDSVGEGQFGQVHTEVYSEVSGGGELNRLGSLGRYGSLLWPRITGVFQLDNDVARKLEPKIIYESAEGISGTAQERAEVRDLERGGRPLPEHKRSKSAYSMIDSVGEPISKDTAEYFKDTHMREGGNFENNTEGPLTRMYRAGKRHFGYTVLEGQTDKGYPTPVLFFTNKVRVAESYGFSKTPDRNPALLAEIRDWSNKLNDLNGDITDKVMDARMDGVDFTKTPEYARLKTKAATYRVNFDRAQKRYEASSEAIKVADGTVREEPGVYEVFLNITKPYVVYCNGESWVRLEDPHGDNPREIADWAYENGYDGVIFDRIVDPGGDNPMDGGTEMTEAVVFSPTQVKSVKNEKPTDNPDYRYSETDDGADYPAGSIQAKVLKILQSSDEATGLAELKSWFEEMQQANAAPTVEEKPLLSKVFQSTLTKPQQTSNTDQINKLLDEYGALPVGEKKLKDNAFPAKTAPDKFVRKHLQTAAEAGITPETAIPYIENMVVRDEAGTYARIKDTAAIQYADQRMRRDGYEKLLAEWAGLAGPEHFPTKHDIAIGELLFIEAAKVGDEATAMKVLADVAAMGTQAGQTVQAMSLLKKMTPSGQLYYLQKAVDRMNKEYSSKVEKGKIPEIQIKPELARAVLEAKTREELDAAIDALLQDIADQTPVSILDKWTAWRYLAMLGNPRTHLRNLFGNTIFMPARFAKDLMAAGLEAAFISDPNQRTKSAGQLMAGTARWWTRGAIGQTEYSQFALADFPEIREQLINTGKYNPADAIRDRRKIFKSRAFGWINTLSDFNYAALEWEDGLALKPAYVSAMSQYLAAHKADVATLTTTKDGKQLLNRARAYAMYEAQKATYRDFSAAATALNRLKKVPGLNVLIDGILPFTKTPINILKRGIEYSPVGLLKALTVGTARLKSGKITASEFIDQLAAGMTGSMIAVLGMLLMRLTLIRGGDDDDKKQSLFDKLQGYQNYSLQIGNVNFTIDWMAPIALPLFVGAELQRQLEDGHLSAGEMLDAMTVVAEPMFSLSMLDGLNTTLKSAGYDENPLSSVILSTVLGYFGQGMPTLTGQLARAIDPNRRKTYIDANSDVPGALSRFWQTSVESKVPGLASTKMAYVDEWGRTDTTSSVLLRVLENFISPGYINLTKTTAADEELQRLAKATGNTDVLPSTATKYFTVDNKRLDLTADQYEQYATERGQTAYRMMNDLVLSAAYKTLTDEQKALAVENVYEYATQTAKQNIAPTYKVDTWVANAQEATGVDPVDSVMLRTYGKIDEAASVTENILQMDWLTDAERAQLFITSYSADTSISDPSRSGREYLIKGTDWQAQEEALYAEVFQEEYDKLIATSRYKNGDAERRLMLHQALQSEVREDVRKQLAKLMRKAGIDSTEKN